jgi:multiple sugar transport system substrate-binding protein
MSTKARRRGSPMHRRDFLKLTGAGVAGAALLPACGGFTGETGGGESNRVIFSHGPDTSGAVETLIKQFNDQQGGKIEVVHRQMPSDTGQYFDQLRTQFQAGGGDIDVISGDIIWPIQFGFSGWIDDLSDRFTEEMRADFLEGPVQGNTYQGKVYGVPWFTDAGMLYYRKDLLQKSGFNEPPQSWDELFSMAKKVQADSGTSHGFVYQGAKYEGGVCNGTEYIWSHGGNIQDPEDEDTIVVDSPEAAAGLETWRATIEEGIAPQSVVTWAEPESDGAFRNGDAVFMRNWPYVYGLILAGDAKIKTNQVGVAPLPADTPGGTGYSTLGGWNLFINSASTVKDQAWEFIEFMTNPENEKTFSLKGAFLPTRKALYQDPQITKKVPVIPLAADITDQTKPRPPSPFYGDLSLEMQEQFSSTLSGDVSPDEAVSTLQESLQGIIDKGTS